jgi:hypothetical protein
MFFFFEDRDGLIKALHMDNATRTFHPNLMWLATQGVSGQILPQDLPNPGEGHKNNVSKRDRDGVENKAFGKSLCSCAAVW